MNSLAWFYVFNYLLPISLNQVKLQTTINTYIFSCISAINGIPLLSKERFVRYKYHVMAANAISTCNFVQDQNCSGQEHSRLRYS